MQPHSVSGSSTSVIPTNAPYYTQLVSEQNCLKSCSQTVSMNPYQIHFLLIWQDQISWVWFIYFDSASLTDLGVSPVGFPFTWSFPWLTRPLPWILHVTNHTKLLGLGKKIKKPDSWFLSPKVELLDYNTVLHQKHFYTRLWVTHMDFSEQTCSFCCLSNEH